MKIKCANCNQKTISFKAFYFPSNGIVCPKCNSILQKKQRPFLYYFLFLTSFSISMVLTKYFIRYGINRYISIPIFLILIFVSLHFSTGTAIKEDSTKTFKLKELLISFLIIYPLLLILMKVFNF
jgi:hypothetical protein